VSDQLRLQQAAMMLASCNACKEPSKAARVVMMAGRALAARARSARMAIAGPMEARRRGALALAAGRVWRGKVRGSALHSRCLWGGYGSQPQRTSIYTFGGESCAATHPMQ
jgi:hypothetical protein